MTYEELCSWFAPLQGEDYAMMQPMLIDKMETLVSYYYPTHLNKVFRYLLRIQLGLSSSAPSW